MARSYGVFDEPHGMPVRGTFLIDAAGVIRFSEINEAGDARDQNGWRAAIAELPAASEDAGLEAVIWCARATPGGQ